MADEVKLIDAELLTTNIAQIAKTCAKSDAQKALIGRILFMIENMPTIEAEPDSGWISVDDRLPEYNQKVFVVYNDVDPTGVSIRRLIIAELAVDGYWMEGCTWHPDTSITHWQPLPEPPKGE